MNSSVHFYLYGSRRIVKWRINENTIAIIKRHLRGKS